MGLSFLNSYAQKSSNVFFKSSGRVKETAQSKKYISLLKGKQLRILYYTNSFSYTVKLEAQIVDKPRLFRAQQVLASASKEVQFSKYFSAHGFFYPPALKEDMDSLLLSVASKK
ncbi:hypothetical protein AGDE_05833 [Angomonas deanei]|nr:hypothetical protein AGDE_05833 [Angomonas deanei]|eukprot:EPY38098.1 hypothetical protein AGDE_05833 [Angomonas deanei]